MISMPARIGAVLCVAVIASTLLSAAATQPPPGAPIPTNDPPHFCRLTLPVYDEGKPFGPVVVKFTITIEGTVKDLSIDQSSNLAIVDDKAKNCVSKWRYSPPTQNGIPTEQVWRAQIQWMKP